MNFDLIQSFNVTGYGVEFPEATLDTGTKVTISLQNGYALVSQDLVTWTIVEAIPYF